MAAFMSVLEEMQQAAVCQMSCPTMPPCFMFIYILGACEEGQMAAGLRCLEVMQQTAVLHDVISCSAAISACGSAGNVSRP